MKSTPNRYALAWRAMAAIVGVLFAGASAPASLLGQVAPNCPLQLSGAPSTNLAALRGQVVYLDFWASWCGPCALSFPFMNTLDHDLRARGLKIVALNMDEHSEDAQRFLGRRPATFAVASGDNASCARAFAVPGMPSTYLIDRNGVVRRVHSGFRRGDAESLRADIETLLAAPAP